MGQTATRYARRVDRGGDIGHWLSRVRTATEWLGAPARDTDLRITVPVTDPAGEFVTVVEVPGVPDLISAPRSAPVMSWSCPGSAQPLEASGAPDASTKGIRSPGRAAPRFR
jgi:hypothetical protein